MALILLALLTVTEAVAHAIPCFTQTTRGVMKHTETSDSHRFPPIPGISRERSSQRVIPTDSHHPLTGGGRNHSGRHPMDTTNHPTEHDTRLAPQGSC